MALSPNRMWVRRLSGAWDGVELCRAIYRRHRFPVHAHPAVHVGLIDAGTYAFRRDAAEHRAEAGDLVVLGPDEPHDGEAGGSDGYAYSQVLVPPARWEAARAGAVRTSGLFPSSPVARSPSAARFVARVFGAAQDGDQLLLDLALTHLVLALSCTMEGAGGAASGPEAVAVERAVGLMEARFAEPLTVLDLAAAGSVSRFALCRAFRSRYGVGPHAWLMGVRLRHARGLLSAGLTGADAAAACGFSDQSHLIRCFKRHFGVTPGALAAPAHPSNPALRGSATALPGTGTERERSDEA